MSTDNTATTWRDLADQLSPDQLASIERAEGWGLNVDPEHVRRTLLEMAREMATCNIVDSRFGDVPVPDGATVDSEGWTHTQSHPDQWSRSLVWRDYPQNGSGVAVSIDGRQQSDGTYTAQVAAYTGNDRAALTADQARRLAAALIEAADELDRLATSNP